MRLAILFGGMSFEHEISIVSAIALKKVLNMPLTFIFLDADGSFYLIPANSMKSNHFSSKSYKKDEKIYLTKGGFEKRGLFKSKPVKDFDTVLNLVHGGQGEDGTVSALLDFYSIPYIGPRKEASVLSFNKWLTKMYAKEIGVECLDYQIVSINDKREINFDYPVIIKPLRLGSSIGVSIVKSAKELDFALDVAFEFDDEVLVEPFVEGINEYNVAGCKVGDEWILSRIEAPQKKEFLDFEQKYLDFSRTESVNSAKISSELENSLKNCFKTVYGSIFEGALIRCDFFVKDEKIILNEINPIPGSMANYLFDDFTSVLTKLSSNLPKSRIIKPDYTYINKVQSAKGPKIGN
ncbi:D-alanine--D-alanine ligase [Hydrogenimonas thermophila]|uniref:D-alanine--D-alanine ligase n=1 Tax=Hydrogenimonas thermophila TaxID=223786 RepID=UPI00293725F3|nr:D-alanine--D-alanine ligase [Hydrogenimonas thermophila]WOE68801.1 D-alanine--D-alanine ligase [Hydrogenimonas thermophila]WOE71311.1 D-alanine--D-alanine ligase [Hydrogenimonas thermophila]